MINTYSRYQKGLVMKHLFPQVSGVCACGCNRELPPNRKKWFSDDCQKKAYIKFSIIKGDSKIIRQLLFQKHHGFCNNCGVYDENWQADHIHPVHAGGGGCLLDNFQTLCTNCHIEKTDFQSKARQRKTISSQAAETLFSNLVCDFGQIP